MNVTDPRRSWAMAVALGVVVALAVTGCATKPRTASAPGDKVITVVSAENFWGSLAEQLGGARVKVTSIISNPDADPQ